MTSWPEDDIDFVSKLVQLADGSQAERRTLFDYGPLTFPRLVEILASGHTGLRAAGLDALCRLIKVPGLGRMLVSSLCSVRGLNSENEVVQAECALAIGRVLTSCTTLEEKERLDIGWIRILPHLIRLCEQPRTATPAEQALAQLRALLGPRAFNRRLIRALLARQEALDDIREASEPQQTSERDTATKSSPCVAWTLWKVVSADHDLLETNVEALHALSTAIAPHKSTHREIVQRLMPLLDSIDMLVSDAAFNAIVAHFDHATCWELVSSHPLGDTIAKQHQTISASRTHSQQKLGAEQTRAASSVTFSPRGSSTSSKSNLDVPTTSTKPLREAPEVKGSARRNTFEDPTIITTLNRSPVAISRESASVQVTETTSMAASTVGSVTDWSSTESSRSSSASSWLSPTKSPTSGIARKIAHSSSRGLESLQLSSPAHKDAANQGPQTLSPSVLQRSSTSFKGSLAQHHTGESPRHGQKASVLASAGNTMVRMSAQLSTLKRKNSARNRSISSSSSSQSNNGDSRPSSGSLKYPASIGGVTGQRVSRLGSLATSDNQADVMLHKAETPSSVASESPRNSRLSRTVPAHVRAGHLSSTNLVPRQHSAPPKIKTEATKFSKTVLASDSTSATASTTPCSTAFPGSVEKGLGAPEGHQAQRGLTLSAPRLRPTSQLDQEQPLYENGQQQRYTAQQDTGHRMVNQQQFINSQEPKYSQQPQQRHIQFGGTPDASQPQTDGAYPGSATANIDPSHVVLPRTAEGMVAALADESDWQTQVYVLNAIKSNQEDLLKSCRQSPSVIQGVVHLTSSLRSVLCKNSLLCLHSLINNNGVGFWKDQNAALIDSIVAALLKKSIDASAFLAQEARAAMEASVQSFPPQKLCTALLHHCNSHPNAHARATAAQTLLGVVQTHSTQQYSSGKVIRCAKDKLLHDNSVESRAAAKGILTELNEIQNLDKKQQLRLHRIKLPSKGVKGSSATAGSSLKGARRPRSGSTPETSSQPMSSASQQAPEIHTTSYKTDGRSIKSSRSSSFTAPGRQSSAFADHQHLVKRLQSSDWQERLNTLAALVPVLAETACPELLERVAELSQDANLRVRTQAIASVHVVAPSFVNNIAPRTLATILLPVARAAGDKSMRDQACACLQRFAKADGRLCAPLRRHFANLPAPAKTAAVAAIKT